MKLNLIKKLARHKQEKMVFKALTRYSKEYGEPSDKTIDKLNEMLDRLLIDSEDTAVSAIVFSEEMVNAKLNDSGVEWNLAKDKKK